LVSGDPCSQPRPDPGDVALLPPFAGGAVPGEHLAGTKGGALLARAAMGVLPILREDREAVGVRGDVHDDVVLTIERVVARAEHDAGQVLLDLRGQAGFVEQLGSGEG